jgi:hypothetical protein
MRIFAYISTLFAVAMPTDAVAAQPIVAVFDVQDTTRKLKRSRRSPTIFAPSSSSRRLLSSSTRANKRLG